MKIVRPARLRFVVLQDSQLKFPLGWAVQVCVIVRKAVCETRGRWLHRPRDGSVDCFLSEGESKIVNAIFRHGTTKVLKNNSHERGYSTFSRVPGSYAGGVCWHDLRRTFATIVRANKTHAYDISYLLGQHIEGVTKTYARESLDKLRQAVDALTEPWGKVIAFNRRVG